MRAKPEEYLIQTKVGGATRKLLWHSDEELAIDFPRSWEVKKLAGQIVFQDISGAQPSEPITIPNLPEGQSQRILLPATKHGPSSNRPVAVEIVKLKSPRPVYTNPPRPQSLAATGPRQLCAFYGQRYFLIRYRPIGQGRAVSLGSLKIFHYEKVDRDYVITALQAGLGISVGGRKIKTEPRKPIILPEVDFFRATLTLGIHWWRFRMVPTPDGQPPLETDESEDDFREKMRLHYSSVGLLAFVALFMFSAYFAAKFFPPPPKVIKTEISLKPPKVMPAFEEIKKPEPPPTPPPKVVEEKKPDPPKPEPKKVVKEPPKAKKPERKVAEHKPPPRKQVATAEKPPPPKKVVEPPSVVEPPPKAVEQGPTPDQLKAIAKAEEQQAQQQQLLKSLSFLSSNKGAPATDTSKYESKTGKYSDQKMIGGVTSKSNALDKITKGVPGDGTIATKSGRGIASNVSFGKNKGLNNVEGKVSEGELYSKNGNPGEALGGGKGLELTGPGELSESQIEKALSKFLSRFQYCYEKALLSDSSLGGTVVVRWTVTEAGRASDSRVIKSQLNNGELHSCVLKILGEVPFPKPKGGSVTVKKTFAFSSSSL